MVIDTRTDQRVCQACLGSHGRRVEPCGACEFRAALEQRADRIAQDWRVDPKAMDIGELLADFAESELRASSERMARHWESVGYPNMAAKAREHR